MKPPWPRPEAAMALFGPLRGVLRVAPLSSRAAWRGDGHRRDQRPGMVLDGNMLGDPAMACMRDRQFTLLHFGDPLWLRTMQADAIGGCPPRHLFSPEVSECQRVNAIIQRGASRGLGSGAPCAALGVGRSSCARAQARLTKSRALNLGARRP